ncbi:PepSY domain-containing protein [Novacetimonas pomaceti]|uniref:PepSY domain-containing protein n=1 Tax=Novacetimonas pomaceti TaxID=2021998 RepID=UPI0030B8F927
MPFAHAGCVLQYNGHEFVGAGLDPTSGALIPAWATAGGGLFYNLHHTLCLNAQMGTVIVSIAGIALLVAIVSGDGRGGEYHGGYFCGLPPYHVVASWLPVYLSCTGHCVRGQR